MNAICYGRFSLVGHGLGLGQGLWLVIIITATVTFISNHSNDVFEYQPTIVINIEKHAGLFSLRRAQFELSGELLISNIFNTVESKCNYNETNISLNTVTQVIR